MRSKLDPRHGARKLALSSIFCWLFSESDQLTCATMAQELLNQDQVDIQLSQDIIAGVKQNRAHLDDVIATCAPDWPLDKISKIDLVILRISIFEILFSDKTPPRVVIDESVELAKEFGNDTSPKFVNGVLGTVVKNLDEYKK